jgi:phosphatidylcholine synthase
MIKFLAWCVHFYTALGLVAAGFMALAIYDGTPASFRMAFLLMLTATIIDATDGTLARLIKVKEVLPKFDGRRLDDLIDFQTYTSLPLLLIWRAQLLPAGQDFWLLLPLLASAYGFCQVSAKTEDGYFLGFPSYWNIVAFYLYVLKPPPVATVVLLATFALLTFVPARYLYPTHRGRLNRWANVLAAPWCVLLAGIIAYLPVDAGDELSAHATLQLLTLISLSYPVLYLVTSWIITLRIVIRALSKKKAAESDEKVGYEAESVLEGG